MTTQIIDHGQAFGGPYRVTIEIDPLDLIRANFQPFDLALWDDINNGPSSNTPLADWLLGLETLMRRCEESPRQALQEQSE